MFSMGVLPLITKTETENLRSALQAPAANPELNTLINIFAYLEEHKGVTDQDQQYRQTDFIKLIYAIYYGKIFTYCELEDYLHAPDRVKMLSKGNSTNYLNLTAAFYRAVINSSKSFEELCAMTGRFIDKLGELAKEKGTLSLQLLSKNKVIIQNLREQSKVNLPPLDFEELRAAMNIVDRTKFNQVYTRANDPTIRTLLTIEFYQKNPKGVSSDLKERTLLRLKRTSIATLTNQQSQRIKLNASLLNFGKQLVLRDEKYALSNHKDLLQQALASNSEAERIVLLAAAQQLGQGQSLVDDLQPSPSELLTWYAEGNYPPDIEAVKLRLASEWSRCLFVDLELIKKYLTHHSALEDAHQNFRRRDFCRIIFYIHYGLIDSIQSLKRFLLDAKRRERLQTGSITKRYDNLTQTFLKRAKDCNNFVDIKNSCAAIIDYYTLEHLDNFFGLYENNKPQRATLVAIRDFASSGLISSKFQLLFTKIEQIYEYLIDNQKETDEKHAFRRFDFMKILRSIASEKMSFQQLKEYLNKEERTKLLTTGLKTQTYYELICDLSNMIGDNNWASFKEVCKRFITHMDTQIEFNPFAQQLLNLDINIKWVFSSTSPLSWFGFLVTKNLPSSKNTPGQLEGKRENFSHHVAEGAVRAKQ